MQPDESEPERSLDDEWRDIVDHYGERPQLPEDAEPAPPAAVPPPEPPRAQLPPMESDPLGEIFVPPDPEPPRLPEPRRLLAWIGVLVVPVALIICVFFSLYLPGWMLGFAVAWFAGGFVYLVATMDPNRRHDDPDDGAVV